MNSWEAISLLVAPSATSCAICASCGVSSLLVSTERNASVLAGRTQLDACSLREALHPEVAEETVRDAQLLARLDVATNAPQPLAVHQMRTGEVEAQRRRSQEIDGVAVAGSPLRSPSLSSARDRAAIASPQGMPLAEVAASRRSSAGRRRIGASGAARRLDELDRRKRPERQVVGVLERGLCRGERVVVARESVVQRGGSPLGER